MSSWPSFDNVWEKPMGQSKSMTNPEDDGRPRSQVIPVNSTGTDRRLLLIEGDATDARLIRGALADARGGPFEVEWVRKLSDGLERLRGERVGAVFADLF